MVSQSISRANRTDSSMVSRLSPGSPRIKAPCAIEPDAFLDVLQNFGIATFIPNHKQAESALFHYFQRFIIDVGARVRRPCYAKRLQQLRSFARPSGVSSKSVVV